MRVMWCGTASLLVESGGTRLLFDPYLRKYDKVSEVIEAAKYYFSVTGRRVIFEYSLIDGVNDSFECADRLARLVKGFPCHINLIALNDVRERGLGGTPKQKVNAFKARLERAGASVTLRRSMGADIEGACGQLRRKHIKAGDET